MKRGIIFFAVLLLIFISMHSLQADTANSSVTGKIITSDMAAGFGLSITVIGPPALTIISPENGTYITNTSLLLNYSVSPDATNIWYNFGSENTTNVTISSYKYFNISTGQHTLYMYANNSFPGNITSRNVSFFINLTRFTILNSEYNATIKGNSTNFFLYSYESLQNLSNVILENNNSGKILFNVPINVTDISGNILFLDNYTNISFNRIEINSTALPNFNKSATLSIYGLTFSNPRILRDGVVCPDSICTQESYSEGILKFNVTQFSVYNTEETPSVSVITPTPSGGAGGGGAGWIIGETFSLDRDQISVSLNPGK